MSRLNEIRSCIRSDTSPFKVKEKPFFPLAFLFLLINQSVGSIPVGQSDVSYYMALRLL